MKKHAKKQPDEKIAELLTDYDELQDLLEDTLQEFEQAHMEIGDALEEIQESLGQARSRLSHCRLGMKRVQASLITYTEVEAPVLPFDV